MHISFIEALYYLFYAIELPNLFLLKQQRLMFLLGQRRATGNKWAKVQNRLEGLFKLTKLSLKRSLGLKLGWKVFVIDVRS
jgi:hypothetical protein